MSRLLRKEFVQLFPIGYLWFAIIALGYLGEFFTKRLDEETFSSFCEGYCDPGSSLAVAILTILFSLVTAWSLFPREHDESTIDFLRALPVSRTSLYLSKVLAAWLLMCVVHAAVYVLDLALLATNPESIGGRFYADVWLTMLLRDCLFSFIIISHGVVLSWFRTTGLALYVIYLLLLMWVESNSGSAGLWSVFRVLHNEYDGSRLLVDTKAILVHTGIALVLLILGYRLWSRTESSRTAGLGSSRGRGLVRGALFLTGFAALSLVLMYQVGTGSGLIEGEEIRVESTEHYRFSYAEADEATLLYIAQHADDDLALLGELLGAESLPAIRVDLTAQSEHAAGLAKWKKVLMDLSKFQSDESQRRVLSHESAHVMQAVLSDRALSRQFEASRFFIEGMAQYTSFVIVPEQARRSSNWEIAAIAYQRQNIRFSDLIDSDFGSRFDPELYYSLGDLWTQAVVDTCGEPVLGNFLRAAGREGAPLGLSPLAFWRDTFKVIGCELDSVNARWRQSMMKIADAVPSDEYPWFDQIRVERIVEDDIVRVEARLINVDPAVAIQDDVVSMVRAELPSRYLIRVASDAQFSASVDPVSRGRLEGEGDSLKVVFDIPGRRISGTRFRFQLGYAPYEDSRYFYEQWQSGSAQAGR